MFLCYRLQQIRKCPMEILEMILSKAYALYFYAFPPHPPEKKVFALLSSVSFVFHETIARRGFKSSLRKVLSRKYYFEQGVRTLKH